MKLNFLLLFAIGMLFITCKKDTSEDETPPTDDLTIEEVISNGGILGFFQRDTAIISSRSSENEIIEGEEWVCESYTVSLQDGLGSDPNGFASFNPNASVVYPGNLLQGSSLADATPKVIPVQRGPGTISINIIDGNENSTFTVPEVTKSSIQDGANSIIDGNKVVPANFSVSATQVHSAEHLALEMGMSAATFLAQFETSFNFRTDLNYSSILVKLDQIFYTLSFDIPSNVLDFFHPDVDSRELSNFVEQGNPATFISDVSYGRIFYLLIQCKSSQLNIGANVGASFATDSAGFGFSIDTDYLSSLEDIEINVLAYGGEASTTLQNFNTTNMDDITDYLAKSTKIETALPISYVVRNVDDRQIVSVKVATEYDVINCLPGSIASPPAATEHWRDVIDLLGGPVGAAANIGAPLEQKIAFFNLSGNQYVLSQNNQLSGPYPLDSLMFGGEPFPLNSVGAAGRYLEEGDYRGTYFFDALGLNFFLLRPDGIEIIPNDFNVWAEGECPFAAEGVGAYLQRTKDEDDSDQTRFAVVNKAGNKFADFDTKNNIWNGPAEVSCWGISEAECDGLQYINPLSQVGAATYFQAGNLGYHVLINKAGTNYTLYEVEEGAFTFTFPFY